MGWAERAKAPLSMLLVQMFSTGMMLLSRAALSGGMFVFSLLAYRNAVGLLFVAPFAFLLERELARELTYRALMWIFVNAMFGVEGLRFRSTEGKIKVMGSLLCVGGAVVFGIYKGQILHIWPAHHIITLQDKRNCKNANILRGTFLLICSCFSYALWFITQVKLFKVYPSKYWSTVWTCFVGALQTTMLGIIIDSRKEAWMLKWDFQLLTIAYSGIFNTGATFCLISWAVSQRGPTYPPMFNSLAVILTTLLESFLFGQQITIGSLLGMAMIFGGLYAFLWANRKEIMKKRRASEGEGSVTVLPVSDK